MLLRSLSLSNIRSYQQAAIEFSEGQTLLWGDVGSGKTTILLAIEFALFGILRGELAAASLLRHGESQGGVTLTFSIDGEDYVIARTLKRDKNGVKQGPGTLNAEPFTPVELRARVLDILGYPQQLLTKAKADVYRYTVYTPQEEMKRILFDTAQVRLETLRSIFGIDQYQAVKENAATLLRELRAEQRSLSLQLEELPHKVRLVEELKAQLAATRKEVEEARKLEEAVKKTLEEQAAKLKESQELVRQHQESKTKAALAKAKLAELAGMLARLKEQRGRLKKALDDQASSQEPPKDPSQDLVKRKEQLVLIAERVEKARERLAGLHEKLTSLHESTRKLSSLGGQCPLCGQQVPHEHKDGLVKGLEQEVAACKEQEDVLRSFIAEAQDKRSSLERHVEELQECRARFLAWQAQAKQRELMARQLREAEEEHARLEQELVFDRKEAAEAERASQESRAADEVLKAVQEAHRQSQEAYHRLQLSLTRSQERLDQLAARQKELEGELQRLRVQHGRSRRLAATARWLADAFGPATSVIEQAVFASLHAAFRDAFSSWFSRLIEDETLSVRLDEEFTPLAELNGYDTPIDALSGGERTAVALAYRLALTHVINEFVGTLNTRDLLILDEPTDGFSAHQLSRLKDVLGELKLRQLIIVSHESALESFAEHLVTVTKHEQSSAVRQDAS